MALEGLPVECNCGNQFRVKAAAAGKRVRCPKCKTPCAVVAPVTVPDAQADDSFSMPEIQTTAPAAESARVETEPELTSGMASETLNHFVPPAIQTANAHAEPAANRKPTGPPMKQYKALRIVATLYRALAIFVVVIWVGGTLIGLLTLVGVASSGSGSVSLPPGVTEDMSPFDSDLSESQREALISHQMTANASSAAGGLALAGLIPWLTATMSAAFVVAFLWATAEGIELAIDVQRNTYHAAYG